MHTKVEECDADIVLKVLAAKDSMNRVICAHTVPCEGWDAMFTPSES